MCNGSDSQEADESAVQAWRRGKREEDRVERRVVVALSGGIKEDRAGV